MKKYTITDKEWESVLNKVQTLEKENQRLTGVIGGMNKAFSLYDVVSTCCDNTKTSNKLLKRPAKYCITCDEEIN